MIAQLAASYIIFIHSRRKASAFPGPGIVFSNLLLASMSGDEAAGSPQLSLSGFSSLFSISGTAPHPHHHLDLPPPSLSLSIGNGGEEQEEGQVVSSGGQGTAARVRMMRNRESALRSRARKRAYMQELEKEVRRLADENLRLKRQCKQLKTEMAALIQQQPTNDRWIGSPHTRTSSTQF